MKLIRILQDEIDTLKRQYRKTYYQSGYNNHTRRLEQQISEKEETLFSKIKEFRKVESKVFT